MPIYEFYCEDCNTLFNFLSRRVNTQTAPACPRCRKELKKQMSIFSRTGRAREENDDMLAGMDEGKMERVLGELAGEAERISEDDPKAMARLMRKFTEKTGLNLGGGMEEALARMERGEDPEQIEREMGDLLEGEDPLSLLRKKAGSTGGLRRVEPIRDETLYEM